MFGAPTVTQWLAESHKAAQRDTQDLVVRAEKARESVRRRVRRRRVEGEGSQLNAMVQHGTVAEMLVVTRVECSRSDEGRRTLDVYGPLTTLRRVLANWDSALGPLVIVGDPGYGKTVAALVAVQVLNPPDEPGRPVAEVLPLSERHHDGATTLSEWIGRRLAALYSVPEPVAREMVDAGMILPIFDGLDEVPHNKRNSCVDHIRAFAGRSDPGRPFVVTCRPDEFEDLRADWRAVGLGGFSVETILHALRGPAVAHDGWAKVEQRIRDGDARTYSVLSNLLRLSAMLRAYRGRDPSALIGLNDRELGPHLWDELLTRDTPHFRGATSSQVRKWLEFLATGMAARSKQRFWLHELWTFTPPEVRDPKQFRRDLRLALAVALALGLGVVWALATLNLGNGSRRRLRWRSDRAFHRH
jgi:hypothetical protein